LRVVALCGVAKGKPYYADVCVEVLMGSVASTNAGLSGLLENLEKDSSTVSPELLDTTLPETPSGSTPETKDSTVSSLYDVFA
jgi:hypothetical protein